MFEFSSFGDLGFCGLGLRSFVFVKRRSSLFCMYKRAGQVGCIPMIHDI